MPDDRYRVGDFVTKGQETGRVIELTSRAGDKFLIVWILSGPRKNQREYPNKGWRPRLDWNDGRYQARCADCGREFKAADLSECFCRTCARNNGHPDEAADRQSSGDKAREHLPAGTKF